MSLQNKPHTDRNWATPTTPWVMKMNWHDLLFMHYRVPIEQLRRLIPEPLEIDTFQGAAWIGIVPFRMTGVAPRFVPPVSFEIHGCGHRFQPKRKVLRWYLDQLPIDPHAQRRTTGKTGL